MPEVLTKYPDVVLEVLSGGGARCGAGQEQKILKTCPPERFCSTPRGETCVYGLDEIGKMTQVSPQELAQRVCPAKARMTTGCSVLDPPPAGWTPGALLLALGVLVALRARRRASSWRPRGSSARR